MTRRAQAQHARVQAGALAPTGVEAARIEVIAPSGALFSRDVYEAGLAKLRALGFTVRSRVPDKPWLRFADTDEGRLAQIHDAARARDVDAVMIARGGYGLSRLLDRIDWPLVADSVRRGVRWIGFSDFTALQLGLLASTGATSWTGPAVCGDFGERDCDPYTLGQFRELLSGKVPVVEWETGASRTSPSTRTGSSGCCCSCSMPACWRGSARSCWVRSPTGSRRRSTTASGYRRSPATSPSARASR